MNQLDNPFTIDDIEGGLKKMANGKASDTIHMNAELLKWT